MLQAIVNITGLNAILQSILLALFFLNYKKGFRIGNRILGLLLFAFGILIFSTMPGASYKFMSYYKIAFLLRRVAFLIPPFFYFYILSFVNPKFQWSWKYNLHFIPFVVFLGLSAYQGFFRGIWYLPKVEEYYVHTGALLLYNVIYLILTIYTFKRLQISFKTFLIKASDAQGKWLRFFVLGYSVFWIINFHNLFLFKVLKLFAWCPYATSINCLIPFLFFNIIAFVALMKPEIFSSKHRNGSYPLDDQLAERYKKKLLSIMDSRRPYLEADLSMGDLARELRISVKHLSHVINNTLDSNFYDFVNQYRIEESKSLLSNGANGKKTILEIAYEAGFNSKSTFNLAFKKKVGLTPREYRKRV